MFCAAQIPSRNARAIDPLTDLEHFKMEVPVLGLLGTPVAIEHNCKFKITDEVQLVCKYLKAYESKKINKLYRDGKWLNIKLSAAITTVTCIHVQVTLWLSSVRIVIFETRSAKGSSINT